MVSKWVATPSLDSFLKRYTQLQCIIQCTMQIPMRYVLINSQHWDTSLLFAYFHKHLKRNLRSKIKFSDRFECVWSSSGSFKEDSWRLHNCLTWAVECLTQLGMSFFFFGWLVSLFQHNSLYSRSLVSRSSCKRPIVDVSNWRGKYTDHKERCEHCVLSHIVR